MSGGRQRAARTVDAWAGDFAGRSTELYFERITGAIEDTVEQMRGLANTAKDLHYAKGDVAEAWHAGTFNVDCARRGFDARATASRDRSVVDVLLHGPNGVENAQLKYFRSPDATAKAISDPAYRNLDQKVVPADQLEELREAALRLAAKNAHHRPEVSGSYLHTAKVVDDRLRMDDSQSRPLTERDARALVQQLRRNHDFDQARFDLTAQHFVQWQDILREAAAASIDAVMIATVLNTLPHLLVIAQKALRTGEMTEADFVPLRQTLPSIVLRSAACAGLSATIVGTARAGFFGRACLGLRTSLVGGGVALGQRALEVSWQAGNGDLTWNAAARLLVQDVFVTAAAVTGALLVAGSLTAAPVLGSIAGNLIGAGVANLVLAQLNGVDPNLRIPIPALEAAGYKVFGPRSVELRGFSVQRVR
jgi:hypothetical protein